MNKLIDFNKIAQESVPIKDVINLKNIVDKTYSCEPYPPDSLKSVEQSYKQQTESQSDILENTMVPVQRVDGQQVLTERSSSPVTQGFLGDLQLRNPQPYDDFYERKAFIPGMVTDTNKNKQGIENKDTVYDWVNYSGCPELFLIKHTVSEEHEDGIDGCAGLIDRKRKNNDFKRKIVANLFFENVIDYGYKYTATAIFLDKNGMVQREEVKITQTGSCETIKAVNELKAYGIDCFSLSTPMKIINSCGTQS